MLPVPVANAAGMLDTIDLSGGSTNDKAQAAMQATSLIAHIDPEKAESVCKVKLP